MTAPESHESTALMCLARIARHQGVNLTVDRLIHDYALSSPLVPKRLILRICRDAGLRARHAKLRWEDLVGLGQAFPCMARLSNGYWIILSGFRGDTPDGELVVLDPQAPQEGFLFLKRDVFCTRWAGEVLFIKRSWSLTDADRPFGLAWFAALFLGQKRLVVDITLAALTLQLLGLATPIFFQLVVDKVLLHQSHATLYALGIAVTVALLFDAVFGFLRRYLLLFVSNKIDIRTATHTFAHLLRLPIDFFERGSAGVLVKHMQQAEKVRQFLTGRLFLTLLDTVALVVFLPVLALYSGTLTLVVLGFTLLIAMVIAGLIRPFQARLRQLYEAEGARQALLVETIHGMRTVKALALEPVQRRVWDGRAAQAVAMQYRVGKISITAQAITGFLEKMMLVAVIVVGTQAVFDGTLTVGALIAFQMLAGRVSGPLVQIVSLIHEYQETALSVRMLGTVMNHRPERGGATGGIRPPLKGGIEFENVTFRYSSDGAPALNGVSFEIPAGRVIGIVGRSGSGKTTVTRLIQGLYTAQEGIVRMDGYDIREIDLIHLRSSIGVVLQDNFMFRGTVRENIAASRLDATLDEIVDVARIAGADEFIERLPRGYETMLEENAANLSGGQKQRLAIARALIKRPRLLILDEATSALDPESEYLIQRNLHLIAKGRTLIIVSHRLSTLAGADQILVLKGGRIAGLGTHEALLGECAPYSQLWQQQTRHRV